MSIFFNVLDLHLSSIWKLGKCGQHNLATTYRVHTNTFWFPKCYRMETDNCSLFVLLTSLPYACDPFQRLYSKFNHSMISLFCLI